MEATRHISSQPLIPIEIIDESTIGGLVLGELFSNGTVPRESLLSFVGEYYWNQFNKAMPRSSINKVIVSLLEQEVIQHAHHNGEACYKFTDKGLANYTKL